MSSLDLTFMHLDLGVVPAAFSAGLPMVEINISSMLPVPSVPDSECTQNSRGGSHLHEQLLLCEPCRERIREAWGSTALCHWTEKGLCHHGLEPCPPLAPLSLHR